MSQLEKPLAIGCNSAASLKDGFKWRYHHISKFLLQTLKQRYYRMSHPEPDWRYVSQLTLANEETILIMPPDWRGYWQYEDELGHERDAVAIMIDWLRDQEPAVWHAFVRDYMNWDISRPIGVWVANQPQCDRATAARLLFFGQPGFCLRHHCKLDPAVDPLATVLQNASRGWYQKSSLFDSTEDYLDMVSDWNCAYRDVDVGKHTFSIDVKFIGPFEGAIADFPAKASPVVNPEMWALIDRLGVDVSHCDRQAFWGQYLRAYEQWESEMSEYDSMSTGQWKQIDFLEHGPCIETQAELTIYLSGCAHMKSVVFERAEQRIAAIVKR